MAVFVSCSCKSAFQSGFNYLYKMQTAHLVKAALALDWFIVGSLAMVAHPAN
jgi:hypothetical protein